jgi:hypothetical protein
MRCLSVCAVVAWNSLLLGVSAFQMQQIPCVDTCKATHLSMATSSDNEESAALTRRSVIGTAFSLGGAFLGSAAANAGLLDDFGSDPNKIKEKETPKAAPGSKSKDGGVGMDPTLRANYYYPTAKKRYLPRIQKVSTEISSIPPFLQTQQWDIVAEFADKTAEDAILPLKLYQSSLDGQGLSMANSVSSIMRPKRVSP